MNTKQIFTMFIMLLVIKNISWAKDTFELKEIHIQEKNNIEQQRMILNTENNGSLSEIIGQNSTVFIKNNGYGGVGSLSIRGGSSSQTGIYWNTTKINTPFLGTFDINLLNSFLFDALEIQNNSEITQGNISGSIVLQNNVDSLSKNITLHQQNNFGSFGQFEELFKINWQQKKSQHHLKIYYQEAQNDFLFHDSTNQKKYTDHASFYRKGFMIENKFTITDKQSFKSNYWWQKNDKKIPANLLYPDIAKQKDEMSIWQNQWNYKRSKSAHELSLTHIWQNFPYQNITQNFSAENKYQSIQNQWKSSIQIHPLLNYQVGLQYYFWKSATSNFSDQQINEVNIFSSFGFENQEKTFKANFGVRQENQNQNKAPIAYNLTTFWQPVRWTYFKSSIHQNYKLPTLNDLFWTPGGNPNLKTEKAQNYEIAWGLNTFLGLKKMEFTYFYKNIKDLIDWAPKEIGSWEYEVQNVQNVINKGLEIILQQEQIWTNWLKQENRLTYIRQENKINASVIESEINKSLAYTPKEQLNFGIKFRIKNNYFLAYEHLLVGPRWTNKNNTKELTAYQLIHIKIGCNKNILFKEQNINFFSQLQLNNITGSKYQSQAGYPMPLENYSVQIGFVF